MRVQLWFDILYVQVALLRVLIYIECSRPGPVPYQPPHPFKPSIHPCSQGTSVHGVVIHAVSSLPRSNALRVNRPLDSSTKDIGEGYVDGYILKVKAEWLVKAILKH